VAAYLYKNRVGSPENLSEGDFNTIKKWPPLGKL
jgi:hypothetical protein